MFLSSSPNMYQLTIIRRYQLVHSALIVPQQVLANPCQQRIRSYVGTERAVMEIHKLAHSYEWILDLRPKKSSFA